MDTTTRLAKTDKGREEIEHRRTKLPGKVRTLLILIDGTRTVDEVARDAQKLGAPEDALIQLMREGFVAAVAAGPRGAMGRGTDASRTTDFSRGADSPRSPGMSDAQAGGGGGLEGDSDRTAADSDYERFRVAKKFMNDTAVDNMGAMKKFTFTLKLERCAVRADLADLVPEYEQALTKSVGPDGASVLVDRLKVLLR